MDFSKLPIFSMMKQRMAYGSERQAVLSQNISNANTPGYRPKDLKPLDFKEMANVEAHKLPLTVTNANHIAFSQGKPERFAAEEEKTPFETTPNGNGVVLEEQLMKMQSNSLDYQTTTSLYRRMTEMFKVSIGDKQ